jgi:tartrate dehydrogenase/decarboxylase / D-malate dehydrogenase
LMLEHLGEPEAASLVMDGLRSVAKKGPRTRDLGGSATTAQVGDAIRAAIGRPQAS